MSNQDTNDANWRRILRSGLASYAKEGSKYFIEFKSDGRWGIYSTEFLRGKDAIIRFDRPHGEAVPYNHVNINSKISGVKDPHIKLSPAAFEASGTLAKGIEYMNTANKVLLPVAVGVDIGRTGFAVYKDCKNNTTRNTTKTVAGISGAWGGGFGGAFSGASIGTAIMPGVGTIIGGIIGGMTGGIGGSVVAEKVVEKVGDHFGYDVVKAECLVCEEMFQIRLYLGEKETNLFCLQCYYIQLYNFYMYHMS